MKSWESALSALAITAVLAGCSGGGDAAGTAEAGITEASWGQTAAGDEATLYTLTNENGMVMTVSNYGGIVTSLTAPDRDGEMADVVLGFETLAEYEADSPYFGALIGRYGNRIAGAEFELDGETYTLAQNNGPNSLHGGEVGFDKVVWDATTEMTEDGPQITLRRVSPDGEEGFPGNLDTTVTYTLTNDDEFAIRYTATTDAPTPVNLTQHTYFNLTGGERDILGHELKIEADAFTPVDDTLIPTGELQPVGGTPFDFREFTVVGERIEADDQQIAYGGGYDHNFVLDGDAGDLREAAVVRDPESGRVLEVWTDEPGVQFYSGNFLDGTVTGKGVQYTRRFGLCLETQHYPDSPNQDGFPSTILRPGQTYDTRTTYKFRTMN